jgi:fumarate hydratase, class II
MGNDSAIGFAASQGNFELNVFKPLLIYNLLHAMQLLNDSIFLFNKYLVTDLKANHQKISYYLHNSLMLVTALSPTIGYDKAAKVAHEALAHNLTLKEACIKLGFLTEEEFDKIVDPKKMLDPNL